MGVGVRPEGEIAGSSPVSAQSSLRQAGIRSIAIVSADSETLVSFRGHLIEMLRADGISVAYIGPTLDAATRRWLDVRAVAIRKISISRNTLSPLADCRTFFSLWRTLGELSPDAVLTTRVKSSVYGQLAAVLA